MKYIRIYLRYLLLWTLLGTVSKLLFLGGNQALYSDCSVSELCGVLFYGARLDVAIAGYLCLPFCLLLIIRVWLPQRWVSRVVRGYFALVAFLCTLAYLSNTVLYSYWGFPLDNTPLLYLKTSPADAFASLTIVQWVVIPLSLVLCCLLLYKAEAFFISSLLKDTQKPSVKIKVGITLVLLLLGGLTILPIRGGVGTGTNHSGSVYFSSNMKVNHAAVNPIFSFVEAVNHQTDLASQYNFMAEEEAERLLQQLTYTTLREDAKPQPLNVILVGLESFSKYIMTETGHVTGVTPCLDRLTAEGWYFTNFYANSVRTDRALVSILSGLPAPTTISIMDMPHKSASLPSIARTLADHNYSTSFYYGGDVNYSNMNSYLISTGFQRVVCDKDFSKQQRTGKWGAADEHVYNRLLDDIDNEATSSTPFLKVLMTESSHEPFDVPYHSVQPSEELNAFAYADSCLGQFVKQLKQRACWSQTLLVIVPDHLGAYPDLIDNYQWWRYEIPLILMGGVLDAPRQIDTVGSQVDLSATILGLLGLPHDDFLFSKDLLDPHAPHFAFFTFPDAMGMITDSSRVIFDNHAGQIIKGQGNNQDSLSVMAKAYLQMLYRDMDKR